MTHTARSALPAAGLITTALSMVLCPYLLTVPAVSAPLPGTALTIDNPSFESADVTGAPRCWTLRGSGHGTATLGRSTSATRGRWSAALRVTRLPDPATRIVATVRSTACAPEVHGGERLTLRAAYRATRALRWVMWYRDPHGWHFLGRSPALQRRATWHTASWTAPTLPPGARAVSLGAVLATPGTVLVDDVRLSVSVSPPPVPTAAPTSTTNPTPTEPSASSSATATTTTPGPTVRVSTAGELSAALTAAAPGQTIVLADGTYSGHFTLRSSGTEAAPIRVTGTRRAVLDGGSTDGGYVLHLDGVQYADIDGITVQNGQKAVVLDQSSHVVLSDLDLHTTGEEVLLLRNYSSDDLVTGNEIHDSGNSTPGYGEGVYIGLSSSNWDSLSQSRTGGGPDRSDRNQVVGNHIYGTTAENVDVKEGTTGGLIADNHFDATGLSGANYADSWVDIAGNDYLVRDNVGVNPGSALLDGYQTHVILSGWATGTVFTGNVSSVEAAGYAIRVQTPAPGTVVRTDNTVTGAAKGLTNVTVTP